ncbi:MAG TPA: GNAT family protein [Devosia sp.]|nr:GNAT family protein [Devosia sp.]
MNTPRPAIAPGRVTLTGAYAQLEPLSPAHAADLFAATSVPDAEERFAYLPVDPPASVEAVGTWIEGQQGLADPIVFALVDRATGRAGGWQQLMRIVPEHGVIEIGYVYWGPDVARTRLATEALYLLARHVFEDLGYRRFEWKCNALNEPSRRAARRFGFAYEGTFHQHMIVKGKSRDTAWFAMLDCDWPRIKVEYERWLEPGNFDEAGVQLTKLVVG